MLQSILIWIYEVLRAEAIIMSENFKYKTEVAMDPKIRVNRKREGAGNILELPFL